MAENPWAVKTMELDGPWSDDLYGRWVDGGYRGLQIEVGHKVARTMSLDFLPTLPGLEVLELIGRFPDGSIVFRLPADALDRLWCSAGP